MVVLRSISMIGDEMIHFSAYAFSHMMEQVDLNCFRRLKFGFQLYLQRSLNGFPHADKQVHNFIFIILLYL